MLTIVTGWSPKCWKDYAYKFASTVSRYFTDFKIVTYTEEPQDLGRIQVRSLWDIPGVRDFIDEFKDDPLMNGREPRPDHKKWKTSELVNRYNFRYDAVKFCRQAFIPFHALAMCDTEYMAWFDADVVVTRNIPENYITSLLPKNRDVAYLGRSEKHSEIGFQLYSARDGAFAVAGEFARLYYSRDIFQLSEWHSAFAFDTAVERMKAAGKADCHDITPGGFGDVWVRSPLCRFSAHLKGKRKYESPNLSRLGSP